MRTAMTGLVVGAVILGGGLALRAQQERGRPIAADWPQWRGPNRDGIVHGITVPEKWPKTLKEEWKVTVGEGVASPVTVGNNLYVFTRHDFTRQKNDKDSNTVTENGTEVVLCLDLVTGKEKWRSEPYAVSYQAGPDAGFPWPRSTPTVAGGRIFTLGMTGILSCLDALTGQRLWRKDCKPFLPYGGNSSLVIDGLCIVHFGDHTRAGPQGGLTAFDVMTGYVKWCYTDGSCPSSGSPIIVELAGERQVVLLTNREFLGVSLATGKKLWGCLRTPPRTRNPTLRSYTRT